MERFERLADARSRLLRVEEVGPGGSATAPGYLLTFEAGLLRVECDPATGEIHSKHVESRDEVPDRVSDAAEEEPWWRLIGFPVTRAARAPDRSGLEGGLRLQFREDDENPKVILFVAESGEVRVFLDPKGWGRYESS